MASSAGVSEVEVAGAAVAAVAVDGTAGAIGVFCEAPTPSSSRVENAARITGST